MTAGHPMQRLMTPSKVTAWVDCPHYLTLRHQVDTGSLTEPEPSFGSFARLLMQKGLVHEQECRADYLRRGKSILDVSPRRDGETFSAWVKRGGNPFEDGWDVVYQMPFIHDGVRGIADFVERVADGHTVSYEAVDAKLTREAAKPGHVLQLCFYSEAIEALTGQPPPHMHIWLGSGRRETLRVNDFLPYWRRLRSQLADALVAGPTGPTVPRPCSHCEFCEFYSLCERQWRSEDSLIYVADIRQLDIAALTTAGVATLTQLAQTPDQVDGLRPERLARLVDQAALQVRATSRPDEPPPFSLITPGTDTEWGHGLEKLPQPDDGDVFLDFEGDPFWRADLGLFFLFGLLERDSDGCWRYRTWWAHDQQQESTAVTELVNYLTQRREQFPDMHIFHYNHTERSELQKLTQSHGVAEAALAQLVDTGAFVDLYVVAHNSIQAGVESYGLKYVERLSDFERSHEIDRGAGAVVRYEHYMADRDQSDLDAIAAYNEDDVRATLALRNWLNEYRPAAMPWRDSYLEPPPGIPELDERVTRLHQFDPETDQYLLGDLLGYWWREWRAYIAPKMAALKEDPAEVLENPGALADLRAIGSVARVGKNGKPIIPAMRFTFPPQACDRFPRQGGAVMFVIPDAQLCYATIDRLDGEAGEVDLVWRQKLEETGYLPRVVVLNDWVDPKPKALALQAFADDVLEDRPHNAVTMSLLRRELPRFAGPRPAGGKFSDDLSDMTDWVTRLDNSYVAIQGPPGSGKTYSGAHLVHALILAGFRVGITAMSHHAIANLLDEVLAVFKANGDAERLNAVRNAGSDPTRLLGITHGGNAICAKSEFNLVAGTTWLFSSNHMQSAPVDVLLIDEAGQLSLADALAASCSAKNLILLGDPLQLAQVAQALHSDGSGKSVLEHILSTDATLSDYRGVFLSETRRMHPDVCEFISEQIYGGRLGSHSDCSRQSTVAGTGLRWLRAEHHDNTTCSAEEAELIADEIGRLIGTKWTDREGVVKPLATGDFMVVAPYNDQVHMVRGRLDSDPRTAGVPVGTVDKFQGREAAVVFFSMATSSGDDVTRGADFLFSRNRLNVAISRARCLAYLVCTGELLNSRARTVEDMRLIATLNAFVEYAQRQSSLPIGSQL